jgi:hypothetical protein
MQNDADKAAATIAVRALNIVTGFFLPHIGLPLGPCPYAACEPPAAVDGADQKTRYQMLLPITQIECDSSYLPARFDDPNSEVFAWAVWREYTGCIPGSGQFIWSS